MSRATLSGAAAEQAAESPWAVQTHGLTKRFGAIVAVNGVDLRIPRGCAFGYLGPNGAGKTTTIRILLGLLRVGRNRNGQRDQTEYACTQPHGACSGTDDLHGTLLSEHVLSGADQDGNGNQFSIVAPAQTMQPTPFWGLSSNGPLW
jgi:hypothetical protein